MPLFRRKKRRLNNRVVRRPFDLYIWYSSSTNSTAKALAQSLGAKYGKRIPPRNARAVLCWGAKIQPEDVGRDLTYLNDKVVINKIENLQLNRDKVLSLKKMQDYGVKVPNFCIGYDEVLRKIDEQRITMPIIARKRTHQGGSGFELCLCKRDIRRARNKGVSHHFLQYIPNDKEYRLHVFDGEIIRVSKKLGQEGCNNWKRNHDEGWTFTDLDINELLTRGIKTEAKKAIEAMDLQFGAVDIIKSDFGEPYVLEINSGPGLMERGLTEYCHNIKRYLNERGVNL